MTLLFEGLEKSTLSSLIWLLADLRFWLAFGQRHQVLAACTLHGLLTTWSLGFPRVMSSKEGKMRVTLFLEPNLRSSIYYFCHFLSIRSGSLGPAHNQGKDMTHRYQYQEAGIIGTILYRLLTIVYYKSSYSYYIWYEFVSHTLIT